MAPDPARLRTLILVRHGQSEGNARNLFTGWLDLPLTATGETEAIKAARSLAQNGVTIGAIFTSTLQRTISTAAIMAKRLGLAGIQPVASVALNERDYGDLAGLEKDQARKRWGAEQVRQWRRSYADAPPNGESLRDTVARVLPYFLHDVLPGVMRGEGVLLVAHGNSLRALIMALEGLSAAQVEQLEVATGEMIIYTFNDNARIIAKSSLAIGA